MVLKWVCYGGISLSFALFQPNGADRGRVQAVMLGVAAAFDFISGAKPRAPKWMRPAGLNRLRRPASESGVCGSVTW